MMRTHFRKFSLAVLALAICTGTIQAAATISVSPAIAGNAITLTCDAVSGATPIVNVGIVSTAASTAVTVSMAAVAPAVGTQGIIGLQSDDKTLLVANAQSVGTTSVNFGFKLSNACKNAVTGSVVNLTFAAGSSTATVAATVNVTNATSTSLTAAPSSITLTCTKNGSAGPAQVVNVTSALAGGTGFYIDTTNALPSWLSVAPQPTSASWATVNPGPTALTLTPQNCTTMAVGLSSPYQLTLANPPAASLKIPVSIQVGNTPAVVPSASTVNLTYTKGTLASGSSSSGFTLTGTSSTATLFNVNVASLPQWLTLSVTSGTVSSAGNTAEQFTASDGAVNLPVGTYSTVVHFVVANCLDATVTVNLTVKTTSSSLSIVETAQQETKNWTIGDPYPTFTVTAISTDAPIEYTNAVVVPYTSTNTDATGINPKISPTQGVAYSFGTPITVSFAAGSLNNLLPGKMPQWQVTLTNGTSGGTVTKILTLNILSPGARIASVTPASLPLNPAASTIFNMTLSGSGFVGGGLNSATQTVVGVLSGGFIWVPASITSVTWINSSTMNFVITVPSTPDPYLNFAVPGTITIGVCNPNGSSCNTAIPAAQVGLQMGGGPIISAVTSASTFVQPQPGTYTSIAPYDIISIFGSSFCSACTIMNGQLSTGTMQYASTLSPDSGTHTLSVQFWSHSASPTLIATAPLLFATPTQINLFVPDALWGSAYQNQLVDIVVNYGPAGSPAASAKYPVIVKATDTGVFTVGGDGAGAAAALDLTVSNSAPPLITASAPALINVGSSDQISLYVTGLGEPDATTSAVAWPSASLTCMAPSDYLTNLTTAYPAAGITSVDGLVVQGSILATTSYGAPCFKSSDTPASSNLPIVQIGGLNATVTYAGWVTDSVAGLYQINVTLPSGASSSANSAFTAGYVSNFKDANNNAVTANTLKSGVALPLQVSSGGVWSQAGVTLNVSYSLTATANHTSITGTAASFAVGPTVIVQLGASNGSGNYSYADLSSALPAGFHLNTSTGAITVTGTVSSTGGAVPVTITVTDTSTNVTGTIVVTFNLT